MLDPHNNSKRSPICFIVDRCAIVAFSSHSPALSVSSDVCNVHLCISVVALLCEISLTDGMCLSDASPVTVPKLFNYG